MKPETLNQMSDLYSEPEGFRSEKISDKELLDFENKIALKLDPDFKEFVHLFGGAFVGALPVYGVKVLELMGGDGSCLERTQWYRKEYPEEIDSRCYVISEDLGGNPIYMREGDARVFIIDHDLGTGGEEVLHESFNDFLDENLKEE